MIILISLNELMHIFFCLHIKWDTVFKVKNISEGHFKVMYVNANDSVKIFLVYYLCSGCVFNFLEFCYN